MYNKKISEICENSIKRNENIHAQIFEILNIIEYNDFPNKKIKCNEPEEAYKLIKDLLSSEKREVQVDFDVIYCLNEGLSN